ncbi:DUF4351 domain-containing protein [Oceanospirillum sediminis]|uniref:DUF4351 domain-containing protein n=1 Tax=Oceanospirillum sediminis TaxID=2760088 RepID=A0A839IN96_9GAMM|nr:DUF4351 domain-containing protein [Oceanospirillum sediminis]MBB1486170.1 hypothetical protein [Oceanospirillum sediminis]
MSKTDLSNTGSDRVKKPGKRLYVLSPDEEIQRLLFMALCGEAGLLKDAEERGFEFGIEIGMQRGISIGEKRGIAVGERQGQVKVLTRQLCRRFRIAPTEIIARVHSGSAEQLEQWADNFHSELRIKQRMFTEAAFQYKNAKLIGISVSNNIDTLILQPGKDDRYE